MSLLEYRRKRRKFGLGEWVLFEGRPAKVMHPGVESAGGFPGRICAARAAWARPNWRTSIRPEEAKSERGG